MEKRIRNLRIEKQIKINVDLIIEITFKIGIKNDKKRDNDWIKSIKMGDKNRISVDKKI